MKDPRLSVEERYPSRERYLAMVQEVAGSLVRERYVLPEDLPKMLEHATEHYELTTRRASPATR
jgi:alpha/beta hydrolase family protein